MYRGFLDRFGYLVLFQKSIRSKILEQLPLLDDYINDILPKKDSFKLIKCKGLFQSYPNEF